MTEQARENLDRAAEYRPNLNRVHDLKVWPEFYGPLVRGEKTFELRKNDRDYRVGDKLRLQEFDPAGGVYTGSVAVFEVTYVLENTNYLQPGVVALGIKR